MKEAVQITQSISALLLIIFVLLQVRGTGFSRSSNSSSFTRRGVEKLVFKLTFVVTALFLIMSAISLFL
jgi:protein translocase SecG subunit